MKKLIAKLDRALAQVTPTSHTELTIEDSWRDQDGRVRGQQYIWQAFPGKTNKFTGRVSSYLGLALAEMGFVHNTPEFELTTIWVLRRAGFTA